MLFLLHGVTIKSGQPYNPNHFVPCIFIKDEKLKDNRHMSLQRKRPRMSSAPHYQGKILFQSIKEKSKAKVVDETHLDPGMKISGRLQSNNVNRPSFKMSVNKIKNFSFTSEAKSEKLSFDMPAPALCEKNAIKTEIDAEEFTNEKTENKSICNFDDKKVSEWDVSTYLSKVSLLDNKGIEKLIKNIIKPDSSFSFPITIFKGLKR